MTWLLGCTAEFFHNPLSQRHERVKTPDQGKNDDEITCLKIILDRLVENSAQFESGDIELNVDFVRTLRDRVQAELNGNGGVGQGAVKVLAAFNTLIEHFAEYFDLPSDTSKMSQIGRQARVDGRASNWREKGFMKDGTKERNPEKEAFERRKLDHRI